MYSTEAADYQEAGSQQGLAYASDAVYEAAEAPDHYQAGTGGGAPHQIPLCPCSCVKAVSVSLLPHVPEPAGARRGLRGGSRQAPAAWGGGAAGRSVGEGTSAALTSRQQLGAEALKDDFSKLWKLYSCFSGTNAEVGLLPLKMRFPSIWAE